MPLLSPLMSFRLVFLVASDFLVCAGRGRLFVQRTFSVVKAECYMSGRLGPQSYVSAVLATFSIIFHCSALGDFKRVIREDKKKNMKNTNGEKI